MEEKEGRDEEQMKEGGKIKTQGRGIYQGDKDPFISPRLLMMARLLLGHIMPLQSGVFLRTAMEMNLVRDVTVAVR